jgi:hypothetical protein
VPGKPGRVTRGGTCPAAARMEFLRVELWDDNVTVDAFQASCAPRPPSSPVPDACRDSSHGPRAGLILGRR